MKLKFKKIDILFSRFASPSIIFPGYILTSILPTSLVEVPQWYTLKAYRNFTVNLKEK